MAINSPLNPGTIASQRRSTPEKAQNFISGGSPLGSSVFTAAANNIVGFTRGAGISPRQPNLGSIIQTLSSNILNNVQGQIQNINQNVTQIVGDRLNQLQSDYQQKVDNLDVTTPNKLLQSFLGLYDKAIGYIRFLGDRRNIKLLGDNLKALQDNFVESFDVAKRIRRTIIRIVNQLSSLPKVSSSGGSGLNLDVNVPGGRLKRNAPRGLSGMMRRRPGMMLGGAALLGAGAGAVATSALSGPGPVKEPEEYSGLDLTEGLLVKFNEVLDRFDQALSNLTGSEQTTGTSSGGGGGGTIPTPSGPVAPSSSLMNANVNPGVETAGLKSNWTYVAEDILKNKNIDATKLSDRAAMGAMLAIGQMESDFAPGEMYSGLGGANNNMQGFLQLNRKYHKVQGKDEYLNYVIPKFKGEDVSFTGGSKFNPLKFAEGLRNAETGWDVAQAAVAAGFTVNDFDPLDTAAESNRLTPDQVRVIKQMVFGNLNPNALPQKEQSKVETQTQQSPTVTPGTAQATTSQQLSKQVAQPPATQKTSTVNVLPMSGGSGQSGGSPQSQTMSSGSLSGNKIPFLYANNDDNFLTLYSKMVYSIVDA